MPPMEGSIFARLKAALLSGLPLSADALQVYAGLICYLAACLVMGRPLAWPWALAAPLGLTLLVEGAEIIDYYGVAGLTRLGAGELGRMLLRHLRDVAVVMLAPLLVFIAALVIVRHGG